MQYTFETLYNQKSLAVMAKCLRKTIRKKKSKRSHIFGWLVVVLAVLLSFVSGDEGFVIDLRTIITWTAGAAIVIALVFEDQINGYFARKRMLKETEKAVSVFDTEDPSGFVSETEIGKSEFSYEKIAQIAETKQYYVFVFSENHAQIYDKSTMSGGTTEEFEHFLCNMTKKAVVKVS